MIYITEIHMAEQGTAHEHIDRVRWEDTGSSARGESTREEMVRRIRDEKLNVHVRDSGGNDIRVGAVDATPPYIRTYADDVWTDNLLALPRF